MNSAFDFKETLDFPFQNTTQAKKLWGRFSDLYIKIYRISTRLNTTPRTSAHVEAVRGLAFRWLERCLRLESLCNLDLVAEYDRCLCPKEMMLKAQSPVIRFFSWHANLQIHALSIFPMFWLLRWSPSPRLWPRYAKGGHGQTPFTSHCR